MRLIMNGGMNGKAAESAERRYGRVFDELAGEHDRRPPAYPDELIDQACRVAGIGSGDLVLEVGCGSGQQRVVAGTLTANSQCLPRCARPA